MFYFSVVVLIMWIIIYAFLYFIPVALSKKIISISWWILIFMLALFSFYAEPSISDDLYRHYHGIDAIRNGQNETHGVFGFYLMQWIVAQTPYNGLLPSVNILVWGWLVYKILMNYIEQNKYSSASVKIYILALFGGCNIFYLVSGIRCALVSAIWVFAYELFYKKGRIKQYYILSLFAMSIHYITILYMILLIVYNFINKNKLKQGQRYIIILLIGIMISITYKLGLQALGSIGFTNEYMKNLVLKATGYLSYEGLMPVETILRYIFIIMLLFINIILLINNDFKNNFIFFLLTCSFALSGVPIFFERMAYVSGIISIYTINALASNRSIKYRRGILFIFGVVCLVQVLYAIHSMNSHIMFNGYDVKNVLRDFWGINPNFTL